RLLSHHAVTDALGVLADLVVNEPAPRYQLRRPVAHVLHTHEISNHVVLRRRIRLVAQVDGSNCYANAAGHPVEERGGHAGISRSGSSEKEGRKRALRFRPDKISRTTGRLPDSDGFR